MMGTIRSGLLIKAKTSKVGKFIWIWGVGVLRKKGNVG